MSALDDPSVVYWRHAALEDGVALLRNPGWFRAKDARGRNILMLATQANSSGPLAKVLFQAALDGGYLPKMGQDEDADGVRLGAYIISANAHGDLPGVGDLFSIPQANSRGEGVLVQLSLFARANDPDEDASWLLRRIGASMEALGQMSAGDWQAGLQEDIFRKWLGMHALANDAPIGISPSMDYNLMDMLRLIGEAQKFTWHSLLQEAFDLIALTAALVDIVAVPSVEQRRSQMSDLVAKNEVSLKRFVATCPVSRRSLIPYILAYNGGSYLWDALLATQARSEIAEGTPFPAPGKQSRL